MLEDNIPTEASSSLDDLIYNDTSPAREHLAIVGSNAGHTSLSISMPAIEAIERMTVYNDPEHPEESAQRELNEGHANGLAIYTLHAAGVAGVAAAKRAKRAIPVIAEETLALMGPQQVFVLAPWTANVRGSNVVTHQPIASLGGVNVVKVRLASSASWSLLDGQHREAGFERAATFLNFVITTGTYPHGKGKRSFFGLKGKVDPALMQFWTDARDALGRMTVNVELHIGLTLDQERQVFADLNNKARKVATDLSYQYDRGNPVIVFIQDELSDFLGSDSEGLMSMTELAGVNAIAFMNKTNVRGAPAAIIAERRDLVKEMWDAIAAVDGFGNPDASVIAEPVVQKAIAKVLFDLAFSKTRSDGDGDYVQTLLADLNEIDFSNDSPMWSVFQQIAAGKVAPSMKGVSAYLAKDEHGQVVQKDLGSMQDGRMVFSVKHNDVYPVIADLIRFRMGLPNRHA